MRSAVERLTGGAGSSHAARGLLLTFLAFSLVSRVADANPHPDLWYVPCVIACYVLPAWFASGRWSAAWERMPVVLLAVQAALSYVPLIVFGSHWVPGVAGLLAGMALALLRSPASWFAFGTLAAAEAVAWLIVGVPYQPAINAVVWLLVAYGTVALGFFGLSESARLLERLETTAEVLADAAVDRERLATAEGLQATIITTLDRLQRNARAALTAGTPTATAARLQKVGDGAREAANSARRIVTAIPALSTPGVAQTPATPAFALRVVLAVVVLYSVQFLMNTVFPLPGGGDPTPLTNVVAPLVAGTMVLLQLRHSRPRADGRPAGWAWTLAVQLVLCFVLLPVFGIVSANLLPFFCGSVLLLVRQPVRWAIVAATIAAVPVLTYLLPGDLATTGIQVQWSIYACATFTAATLVVYGLGRFVRASAELADARRLLAETAVTRERVRIARDTHDTLGLALSAIALKSDLAQALLTRDPERARREIVQTIHLSRTVAADADSIVHGDLTLHLDAELAAAEDALRAAGARVTVDRDAVPLTPEVETELAAILREAVANVLRHSDARTCSIRMSLVDDAVELEVVNDGAHESGAGGRGLENIQARAATLGGSAEYTADRGRFTLSARVPLEQAAAVSP